MKDSSLVEKRKAELVTSSFTNRASSGQANRLLRRIRPQAWLRSFANAAVGDLETVADIFNELNVDRRVSAEVFRRGVISLEKKRLVDVVFANNRDPVQVLR
uniref:Uncharacterized protein n=1 Tax=Parascaris equorum TaxID=6256 RepID=A0A914R5F5_PAREQ